MRLRDFHSDKVVSETRNLNNPRQTERSVECSLGYGGHPQEKACRRHATIDRKLRG